MTSRRRRGVGVALVLAAVVALLAAPSGAVRADASPAADTAFVPGSGAASATMAKARLFYAGYSLQVALGLAATTYENHQSRALGSAYDLSSALSLAKVTVPELSPRSIDSNAGDATAHQDSGAGPVLGNIDLAARTVPASTSDVRLADLDLPGLVRVEGGASQSSSSIVDGKARRAQASVTVGSVSLLGGLLVLDGLHWDATHQTGSGERADATFTLERLSVAGLTIASDLHDLAPVLQLVDAALAPVGLVVDPPQVVHRDNGAVDATALRIGLLNSPLGAQALAPLIAGVRPLLLPVYDALTQADDTLGLASLVADLGLGVIDGSGGVELSIGGATARTDDAVFSDPLAGAPAVGGTGTVGGTPSGATSAPSLGGPIAAPAASATPGSPTQILPTTSEGPARCVLVASPRRHGTCRGSNVPGAIAVVAIVVASVAALDVRARRRRGVAASASASVPLDGGPA